MQTQQKKAKRSIQLHTQNSCEQENVVPQPATSLSRWVAAKQQRPQSQNIRLRGERVVLAENSLHKTHSQWHNGGGVARSQFATAEYLVDGTSICQTRAENSSFIATASTFNLCCSEGTQPLSKNKVAVDIAINRSKKHFTVNDSLMRLSALQSKLQKQAADFESSSCAFKENTVLRLETTPYSLQAQNAGHDTSVVLPEEELESCQRDTSSLQREELQHFDASSQQQQRVHPSRYTLSIGNAQTDTAGGIFYCNVGQKNFVKRRARHSSLSLQYQTSQTPHAPTSATANHNSVISQVRRFQELGGCLTATGKSRNAQEQQNQASLMQTQRQFRQVVVVVPQQAHLLKDSIPAVAAPVSEGSVTPTTLVNTSRQQKRRARRRMASCAPPQRAVVSAQPAQRTQQKYSILQPELLPVAAQPGENALQFQDSGAHIKNAYTKREKLFQRKNAMLFRNVKRQRVESQKVAKQTLKNNWKELQNEAVRANVSLILPEKTQINWFEHLVEHDSPQFQEMRKYYNKKYEDNTQAPTALLPITSNARRGEQEFVRMHRSHSGEKQVPPRAEAQALLRPWESRDYNVQQLAQKLNLQEEFPF